MVSASFKAVIRDWTDIGGEKRRMMRLGFGDGSYEIHGTNRPVSVGMATTNGCIGMYPEDVAALFKLVGVGTPVRLVNGPVNARYLTR
jgi:lipoprotein-anchoring transpeptidase ErfK/SrfK